MKSPRSRPNRSGFSLIELLVVVVVTGILFSIAYVSLAPITRRANVVVLRSDMRSVLLAESLYQRLHLEYTAIENLPEFAISEGVTLDQTWTDPRGFAVTGTHVGAPGAVCGAFLGDAPEGAAEPADREGVIVCE